MSRKGEILPRCICPACDTVQKAVPKYDEAGEITHYTVRRHAGDRQDYITISGPYGDARYHYYCSASRTVVKPATGVALAALKEREKGRFAEEQAREIVRYAGPEAAADLARRVLAATERITTS